MMRQARTVAIAAASLLTLAQPAIAQISPVFDMGGLTATASMGAVINSERRRAVRGGPPIAAPGRAFTRPAPPSLANVSLRYPVSPALKQRAVADLVDRVRQHSPENAAAIAQQLAAHDYARIYDGIVRPYGLAGNDAASSMAAYLVLGWMIVHGGQEPSPAGVHGVRAQAVAALSDERLASPAMHANLGEEFKILFVTVHAGWQAARREGNLEPYAAGIAQMFRQQDGLDLPAMRIGPAGFQPG
jgi:hypothetical protein